MKRKCEFNTLEEYNEYLKAYRAANTRKWYQKNKEYKKEYMREYRKRKKEEALSDK